MESGNLETIFASAKSKMLIRVKNAIFLCWKYQTELTDESSKIRWFEFMQNKL